MHIFFILFTIHLIVNAFCRFCPFFFLWEVNLIVINISEERSLQKAKKI